MKVLVHPKDYPWIEVSESVSASAWTRRKRFSKDHVLYQRLRVQAIEALDESLVDLSPPQEQYDWKWTPMEININGYEPKR